MLLRDDRQVALNVVETLCIETADHYTAAANSIDDAALAHLFNDLAGQRRLLADELAAHIRALDDLPQQPDPDREAAAQALSAIKAFFSGNAKSVLLDERKHAEEKLATAVHAALQQDFSSDTVTLLERILAHTYIAKERLSTA